MSLEAQSARKGTLPGYEAGGMGAVEKLGRAAYLSAAKHHRPTMRIRKAVLQVT